MIVGWDLASRKCGFCAGAGDKIPVADAILLPQYGEDLGAMIDDFDRKVQVVIDRFRPTHFVYEKPILVINGRGQDGVQRTDKLLTIRKLYNLGGHLEFMAKRQGILCVEENVFRVKKELAGSIGAKKADMIAVCERIGIPLPATLAAGREDAADAVGAWLVGVRHYAKAFTAAWDKRIWQRTRGALL